MRQLELPGLVALAAASAVFVVSWAALDHGFYAQNRIVDKAIYESYGQAMRNGRLPYRDFAVEYPPGALPVFVAPTYSGGSYAGSFGWLMAGCGLCCLGLVALSRPSWFALPFLAVSPLLLGSLASTRFDFWPAAFVVGALAAFLRDRHRLGWVALGGAFAIKIFPAVLVPVALVWTLRRRGRWEAVRGLALWSAVVAAAFVPFALMAGSGLLDSLWGQLSRPLQIETLAASFLMTFGRPEVVRSHGSLNIGGHGALGASFGIRPLVVLPVLWAAFARGPAERERFVRYAVACVCAFVVFGKVLSPQYLIWLVPLVPLVRGRRGLAATVLLVAALVDTQVWFPARYFDYVDHARLAWLVLVRDLLLVGVFAVLTLPARGWLRSSWRGRRRHTRPARPRSARPPLPARDGPAAL
jgi:hypothetical protein